MNPLPQPGRPGVALLLTVERAITHQDLVDLAIGISVPTRKPGIANLKAVHHAAARLLATGKSVSDVAYTVGKSPQRIGDLAKHDPAFQDLVAHYRSQVEEVSISDAQRVHIKLLDVAETALDEMQDRLDDDSTETRAAQTQLQKLPMSELREVIKLGLDRTVAPPRTAQPPAHVPTRITFNIGTRDLRPSGASPASDSQSDPHAPTIETIEQED